MVDGFTNSAVIKNDDKYLSLPTQHISGISTKAWLNIGDGERKIEYEFKSVEQIQTLIDELAKRKEWFIMSHEDGEINPVFIQR